MIRKIAQALIVCGILAIMVALFIHGIVNSPEITKTIEQSKPRPGNWDKGFPFLLDGD